jgi:hypothetical protein
MDGTMAEGNVELLQLSIFIDVPRFRLKLFSNMFEASESLCSDQDARGFLIQPVAAASL